MKRLVLAGGGHAHLQVLKTLASQRLPDTEVVLVSPYPRQIYSGMVPGWMAGHYRLEQCAAPLAPLVGAAGVRFVQDAVIGVNAEQRVIHTRQSGDLPYDVLSLATGALVDTTCLAATEARLIPIRPLETFVIEWRRLLEDAKTRGKVALAVVGGGAAGVELALAAAYRLRQELGKFQVSVRLIAGAGLLPGHGPAIVKRVVAALERQRVELIDGYAAGCPVGLQLSDGQFVPADYVLAATGVRPAKWLAGSGLALAEDGFVAVGDGQQSRSHPAVFAAGDIASRTDFPHAKSGVYAVRAGPVLATNLPRALRGLAPLPNQPQQRSLYLLAIGPQSAIMSWGGLSAGGVWAWRWKDWIDRRFMRQYESVPAMAPEKGAGG